MNVLLLRIRFLLRHRRAAEAMAAALQAVGVPVKFRRIPGGGHGPSLVADPAIAAAMVAWFDEHLPG